MSKIVSKRTALKLWKAAFGDALWAQDCFGTWIYHDDYGKRGKLRDERPSNNGRFCRYGWVVGLIMPAKMFHSKDEALFWNNLEPMHYENAKAKGDSISFVIAGTRYMVCKCSICASKDQLGYGIMDASTSRRVDWKYRKRRK